MTDKQKVRQRDRNEDTAMKIPVIPSDDLPSTSTASLQLFYSTTDTKFMSIAQLRQYKQRRLEDKRRTDTTHTYQVQIMTLAKQTHHHHHLHHHHLFIYLFNKLIKVAQCQNDCWDTLQNKNNRKDVRAAQQRKSVRLVWSCRGSSVRTSNNNVLSCLLNAESDGEEVTSAGRVFHTSAAAMETCSH